MGWSGPRAGVNITSAYWTIADMKLQHSHQIFFLILDILLLDLAEGLPIFFTTSSQSLHIGSGDMTERRLRIAISVANLARRSMRPH
jgi:hypothetical protein